MSHTYTVPSIEFAANLVLQHYQIQGKLKSLMGEVDYNFYLKTEKGEEYLIKISRPGIDRGLIAFQVSILEHLASKDLELNIPTVILTMNGEAYVELNSEGEFLRLHRWVPGRMLAEVNPRSSQVLESWGRATGLLSKHLQGFDHPAAHRSYKWNPSETLNARKHRSLFQQEEEIEIADYFWQLFEEKVQPQLATLRKSVNYNDAHEHNLLVDLNPQAPQVTGVIDFGDALYTETVNELAIACAYAGMGMPNPLEAMAQVIRGYHAVFPLEEKEVAVLFPLVAARLMITVATAAWNKEQEPDNEYLQISEQVAWDLLRKMRNIPIAFAHFTFREACDWPPVPWQKNFNQWIKNAAGTLAPVVNFQQTTPVILDLSVGSLDLGNNENFNSIAAFNRTIESLMEEKEATFGIGGYGEVRPFYTTDAYQVEGNNGAQWRTVHLGVDVWGEAETPVYAPLDAKVHSLQNNAAERDYGPTIILQHRVSDELIFFTLYGHLTLDSLEGLEPGQSVHRGQQIAKIGPPPENGNWPPHLHFQVMLDMLGKNGDFPGVAFPTEWPVWSGICPDPAPFFSTTLNSLNPLNPLNPLNSLNQLLQKRKTHLGKSLSISYAQPLHIVRGFKQYLYDTSARRYLDTVNNVAHVGHEHPRVVKAGQRQMALLNTNTRYLHENLADFAEALLATLPAELSVVHFVNSGSEANELAIRMAETYTGQKDMLAVEVGYHGSTGRCVDVSSYKFDGKGGKGAPPYTHVVPIPDTYRGLYRDVNKAGEQYADHVKTAIDGIRDLGRGPAAFVCESILSCGGQIVLPEGYLQKAYAHVREAGAICIADEVQVGFGRVGEHFWGFELQGVVPDIVTLGKPIGNGHPLGAVVTSRAVADAFVNGMEYFSTFGGNPVSCAIGSTVLEVIKEEGLQSQAKEVGAYLLKGLRDLQSRFPIIGDVRGHGLFLGFELVKNRETLEPAAEATSYLSNRMRERGILTSTDGPLHNVIKIKPPMCFGKEHADFMLANLEVVLREDFMQV